jgi:hypothetical protein
MEGYLSHKRKIFNRSKSVPNFGGLNSIRRKAMFAALVTPAVDGLKKLFITVQEDFDRLPKDEKLKNVSSYSTQQSEKLLDLTGFRRPAVVFNMTDLAAQNGKQINLNLNFYLVLFDHPVAIYFKINFDLNFYL